MRKQNSPLLGATKGFIDNGSNGELEEVDAALLDLTDMENERFIYPL